MGYIMIYIGQKLWDLLGKNYGIHCAKSMRYIGQKLWDISGENYRIYWENYRIYYRIY